MLVSVVGGKKLSAPPLALPMFPSVIPPVVLPVPGVNPSGYDGETISGMGGVTGDVGVGGAVGGVIGGAGSIGGVTGGLGGVMGVSSTLVLMVI